MRMYCLKILNTSIYLTKIARFVFLTLPALRFSVFPLAFSLEKFTLHESLRLADE